jgi:hypothetical protein
VVVSALPAISLDDHAAQLPEAIDFLGIDVEGAEMSILSGGRQTISRDVLGVLTEVMFYKLLEGQKTFGELSAFLESSGYRFVWIKPHPDQYAFSRRPIGLRGRGGVTDTGDALFLRDPEHVRENHPEPDLGLAKLAFMALNFALLEYALDALDLIVDFSTLVQTSGSFGPFLHQLHGARRRNPILLPPLFSEIMTAEESANRFTGKANNPEDKRERLRVNILSKYTKDEFQRAVALLWKSDDSEIESIIRDGGFDALADTVHEHRLSQMARLMLDLGFLAKRDDRYVIDPAGMNAAVDQHCKA